MSEKKLSVKEMFMKAKNGHKIRIEDILIANMITFSEPKHYGVVMFPQEKNAGMSGCTRNLIYLVHTALTEGNTSYGFIKDTSMYGIDIGIFQGKKMDASSTRLSEYISGSSHFYTEQPLGRKNIWELKDTHGWGYRGTVKGTNAVFQTVAYAYTDTALRDLTLTLIRKAFDEQLKSMDIYMQAIGKG